MEKTTPPADIAEESLAMHASGRPGKLETGLTKPLTTQRDLALAYSPGVAAPCLRIAENPDEAYDYTTRGNMVAVISNGTAVLGLGNLGALASKPVMEGKVVLFKRFADIDGIDLEIDTDDVDEFVNCVRYLGPSFGGINLEDIKAPECFVIEQRLRELLDIPVFHDDQHGTAIIAAAGLINSLHLTGRDIRDTRMVVNGAGASAIACVELIKALGMPHENVIMCDSKGVIYQGREAGMNQWKSAHAADTPARSLAEAVAGSDVFMGLSMAGAMSEDMVASMADRPIIFAMANPEPEIRPELARKIRPDCIMATGRSDYPNQVNNVLGFPYIFRGALDVRASTINDEMKIAAAEAIAKLAREDVPDEVGAAYADQALRFGPDYIIPVPFDPRLISCVPPAVARAAVETGVARKPIEDMETYSKGLAARRDPTFATLQAIFDKVKAHPQRVVFAEGEEEKTIRAAVAFFNAGYGRPVLIGREDRITEKMRTLGLSNGGAIEITNARLSEHREAYYELVYDRLKRQGSLMRDCQRMVNQGRNIFGACMVKMGHADAMVTGLTRGTTVSFDEITRVLDPRPGERIFGMMMMAAKGRTVFIADTSLHELPEADELADFAQQSAARVRQMGYEPRVALLSYSNFGAPMRTKADRVREAVRVLDARHVDFEYDGEMSVDTALDFDQQRQLYPFTRLTGSANVLIMPGLHSANISTKLMKMLGGGTIIGPMLIGIDKPVQISNMRSTVSDLVNLAALAAHEAIG